MSGFLGNLFNQAAGAISDEIGQKFGGSFGDFLKGDGLTTLLQQAKSAGLDDKVRSWIGKGQNLPISADEVRQLLTSDQVEALVAKTGLPAATLLPAIAEFLPAAVDSHTSDGQIPTRTA